jgi:hypothetical protein
MKRSLDESQLLYVSNRKACLAEEAPSVRDLSLARLLQIALWQGPCPPESLEALPGALGVLYPDQGRLHRWHPQAAGRV